MGHHITALLVRGLGRAEAIARYQLEVRRLEADLTLAFVSHYASACWQKLSGTQGLLPVAPGAPVVFPQERVLTRLAAELTGEDAPLFAVVYTDYFGGLGEQFAQVFRGDANVDPSVRTINDALRILGVACRPGCDEFDSVGLGAVRANPESLDRYVELAEELGV